MSRALRIAMVGSRGVPATWGGIEHHVEAIGRRLVERGHEVTVFCEHDYVSVANDGSPRPVVTEHLGMSLVTTPSVSSKHLEALAHSARSTAALLYDRSLRSHDIVHYHAIGPGVFSFAPRFLSSSSVVQTIHGLDAQRDKWGRPARALLNGATWMSARVPDSVVVVSEALADHYAHRYGRDTIHIPNGVDRRPRPAPGCALRRLGLEPHQYVLFVGRLVPEKRPDVLIRAFREVPGDIRLAIVGGVSYTDQYVSELRRDAFGDPRVLMPGYVYGDERDELYAHAAAFVLPSALEGLPLTLLEAVESGRPVIASDIGPHREVLGASRPGGRLFEVDDETSLTAVLRQVLGNLESETDGARDVRADVLQRYDWDDVTDRLEDVYLRLRARSPHRDVSPPRNVVFHRSS